MYTITIVSTDMVVVYWGDTVMGRWYGPSSLTEAARWVAQQLLTTAVITPN